MCICRRKPLLRNTGSSLTIDLSILLTPAPPTTGVWAHPSAALALHVSRVQGLLSLHTVAPTTPCRTLVAVSEEAGKLQRLTAGRLLLHSSAREQSSHLSGNIAGARARVAAEAGVVDTRSLGTLVAGALHVTTVMQLLILTTRVHEWP